MPILKTTILGTFDAKYNYSSPKWDAPDVDNQYFHPKKIFAIVDLDIQIRPIDNYQFLNTQEIFCNLYDKSKINETNANNDQANHEILVTGLIHKEAYFLVPALQSIFDEYGSIA